VECTRQIREGDLLANHKSKTGTICADLIQFCNLGVCLYNGAYEDPYKPLNEATLNQVCGSIVEEQRFSS
jgi:hypothetical protein